LRNHFICRAKWVNKEDILYNEGACGNGITKIKTSLINDTYPAAFFEAFSKRFVALERCRLTLLIHPCMTVI
jgi:hypothetical protein